jgi:hypothetical protein
MKKIGLLLVVVLLSSLSAFGAVFTINNTGLGGDGAADPYWSIVADPDPLAVWTVAYKVNGSPSSYPFPGWGVNDGTSGWIAPRASYPAGNFVQDAAGLWVFQVTFSLSSNALPASATIAGQWMADNQGAQITLNGTPLGKTTGANQFATWTDFTIGAGSPFVTGLNTLLFTVNNEAPQNALNPVGLRVKFSEGAVQLVPEPATFGLIGLGLLALAALRRRK